MRIFAADVPPKIDGEGRVTVKDSETAAPGSPKGLKGGDRLTSDELASLRRSIFYTRPPKWIAACCIPRHLFAFYRPGHRFVGDLRVCFECGCAEIEPSRPPKPSLSWVDWDEGAVRKIVRAHKLDLAAVTE